MDGLSVVSFLSIVLELLTHVAIIYGIIAGVQCLKKLRISNTVGYSIFW